MQQWLLHLSDVVRADLPSCHRRRLRRESVGSRGKSCGSRGKSRGSRGETAGLRRELAGLRGAAGGVQVHAGRSHDESTVLTR